MSVLGITVDSNGTNSAREYFNSGTSTFYYSTAGISSPAGFSITDTPTDSGGVGSVTFPDLSGVTGFTGSGGVDAIPPYSSAYSFSTSATTAPADKTITVTDLAGNVTNDTMHFARDATAPSGGSVVANGSGSPSTSASVTVGVAVTNYTDGGSGVGSNVLSRYITDPVASACPSSHAAYSLDSASVTLNGSFQDTGLLGDKCYFWRLAGTDRVANQSTTDSSEVRILIPNAPNLTISSVTGSVYYLSGSGTSSASLFFRPVNSASGSFKVTAAPSDANTATTYTFPALGSGWTPAGQNNATDNLTYSYTDAASSPGAKSVTFLNPESVRSAPATLTVTGDSTAPTSVVQFPAASGNYNTSNWNSGSAGCTGGPATGLCGTVSDAGSGVTQVQISLRDGTSNYYDGSGFNNVGETYLATTGTANWNYALAAAKLTDGHTYTLHVKATDNVGNVETVQTVTFKADTTAPTSVVQFPADSGQYSTTGWNNGSAGCTGSPATGLCGTVSDATSGVAQVQVSLRDGTSSGNYYDGSTFANAGETYLAATGAANWNYALAAAKLTDGHTYTLHVKATDNAGNVESVQTVTFTYDTTAAAASVTTPASNGIFYNASTIPANIAGSASDAASGVATVKISILESGSGNYLNQLSSGAAFNQASQTFLTATGTTSWTAATANIPFANGNTYTITVKTTDNAGNIDASAATRTLVYDTSAPTASVTTPASNGIYYNAATIPANIAGTAADSGAGVATVKVSIRESGSGNYLNQLSSGRSVQPGLADVPDRHRHDVVDGIDCEHPVRGRQHVHDHGSDDRRRADDAEHEQLRRHPDADLRHERADRDRDHARLRRPLLQGVHDPGQHRRHRRRLRRRRRDREDLDPGVGHQPVPQPTHLRGRLQPGLADLPDRHWDDVVDGIDCEHPVCGRSHLHDRRPDHRRGPDNAEHEQLRRDPHARLRHDCGRRDRHHTGLERDLLQRLDDPGQHRRHLV